VPSTPDRAPGVLDEEGIVLEPTQLAVAEGELRYDGTRFSLYDAGGEFDPRSGGSGLTPSSHRGLDQLVHAIAEDSFAEYIYSGVQVTDIIIWTDNGKTDKIRETTFTYTGNKVTTIVTKQYGSDGSTVVETLTQTLVYSGNKVTDITAVLT
jgi:hypothetical protein